MSNEELKERIRKIRCVVMDIDGVLTDGRIIYGNYGDELKFFDVQDGFAVAALKTCGLKTAWVTARKSRINQKRAKELQVTKLCQNVKDKRKQFQKLLKKFRLSAEEACFIGDDLPDLGVLREAGLAVAVGNAAPEVKAVAHYVTEKHGGRGAVRETTDLILKTQGRWDELLQKALR
jgi:3-deoxy-D-manno-octulosonate 8-phosphate phosphatase (KDO 8-P phosphatase)